MDYKCRMEGLEELGEMRKGCKQGYTESLRYKSARSEEVPVCLSFGYY